MDVARGEMPAEGETVRLRYPTGVMVAACLAAAVGLLVLALVNIVSEVDTGFRTWITLHSGIGPYSGKELFLFGAWFGSWPILHFALRRRELNLRRWFGIFLAGVFIAALLLWPPLFKAIGEAVGG